MNVLSFLDELTKLGAISDDQAQAALDRLEALEKTPSTAGRMGRYAAIGAMGGPIIAAAGNAVRGKPMLGDAMNLSGKIRELAGNATTGALTGAALPVLRQHSDRRVEVGTLKRYLAEQQAPPALGPVGTE